MAHKQIMFQMLYRSRCVLLLTEATMTEIPAEKKTPAAQVEA